MIIKRKALTKEGGANTQKPTHIHTHTKLNKNLKHISNPAPATMKAKPIEPTSLLAEDTNSQRTQLCDLLSLPYLP